MRIDVELLKKLCAGIGDTKRQRVRVNFNIHLAAFHLLMIKGATKPGDRLSPIASHERPVACNDVSLVREYRQAEGMRADAGDLNLDAVEAAASLKLLQDHEYLRPIEPTVNTGAGRKPMPGAQVFEVNPHVLSDSK